MYNKRKFWSRNNIAIVNSEKFVIYNKCMVYHTDILYECSRLDDRCIHDICFVEFVSLFVSYI